MSFFPLESTYGRQKEETRRGKVDCGIIVVFPHPRIHLWRPKGGGQKGKLKTRQKVCFPISEVRGQKEEVESVEKVKVICCFLDF